MTKAYLLIFFSSRLFNTHFFRKSYFFRYRQKNEPVTKGKRCPMNERLNSGSFFERTAFSSIIVGEDRIPNCSCFLKKLTLMQKSPQTVRNDSLWDFTHSTYSGLKYMIKRIISNHTFRVKYQYQKLGR